MSWLFLLSLTCDVYYSLLHPGEMFTGWLAMGVAFGLFYYFTNARPSAERFRKEHPVLSLVFVIMGGGFIVYMFGSILVFLFGILLPIAGENSIMTTFLFILFCGSDISIS